MSMKNHEKITSKSLSKTKELKLRDLIEVLFKYVPEDKVKLILSELGLLSKRAEEIIEELKSKKPRLAPISHKDPLVQREYERLYLSLSSLREYVSSLDRRVTALERAMERVLEQLSSLESKSIEE